MTDPHPAPERSEPHPIGLTAADCGRRSGQVAEAMAACIRGRIEGLGHCDRASLLADGFTGAEIARWYDTAAREARAGVTPDCRPRALAG